MNLWDEGRERFLKRMRDEDQNVVDQFLCLNSTVEEAKLTAVAVQADSDKRYGGTEKSRAKRYMVNIIDNMDRFIQVGNAAVQDAPDSVGMAWWATKTILMGIQNNKKLYDFFSECLAGITEMLVLIHTYDSLYDRRTEATSWKPSIIILQLLEKIRDVYASILDFSFAVKKYTTVGKRGKLLHALKDVFGENQPEFEDKWKNISELKTTILQNSHASFQQATSESLGSINDNVTDVKALLRMISDLLQTSQQLSKADRSTQPKSHWEIALQTFKQNEKTLNPLPSAEPTWKRYLSREPDTCEWLVETTEYVEWRNSSRSNLVNLKGEVGMGRSTLASFIVEVLQAQIANRPDFTVQYYFCEDNFKDDSNPSQNLARLENTLIYYLYSLACKEQDSFKLQQCNEVFENPKQKKAEKMMSNSTKGTNQAHRNKKDSSQAGFTNIYEDLVRILGKKVFLIVDGADSLGDGAAEFVEHLQDLIIREGLVVHVFLTSSQGKKLSTSLSDAQMPQLMIRDFNESDVEHVTNARICRIPGWSQSERDEAFERVVSKANSSIRYVVEIAIPFLQEPFQRPLSRRLDELPDNINEKYSEHVRQIGSNYSGLLKTALTWALLGAGDPKVEEVMDAYTGIFTTDAQMPTSLEDPDTLKDAYAQQIRAAGGPFLEVKDVVEVTDYDGIWDYCFESEHDAPLDEEHMEEHCSRCQAILNSPAALAMSERDAELEMAITCIRHLNSPLFQSRYLPAALLAAEDLYDSDESEASENEDPEEGEASVSGSEEEENDEAAEDGGEGDEDNNEATEDESEDEDSESEDGDESENDSDDSDYKGRYEIANWLDHIKAAENLWSSEERADSRQWDILKEECTKFFTNKSLFQAWKKEFLERSSWKWLPLHVAAWYGLTSLSEMLLDDGADIMKPDSEGYAALHWVSEAEDPLECLQLLLSRGADPNFESAKTAIPAFHDWFQSDPDKECVQELLRHGADCQKLGEAGWGALHYFAMYGTKPEVLDLLLDNPEDEENRADINVEDSTHETPLHKLMARTEVPIDLLEAFIARGADVNAEDEDSERPLFEAAQYGETEAMKIILQKGDVEDIDDEDTSGLSALHIAAWHGFHETVMLLLANKAEPNKTDHEGRTALFFACTSTSAKWTSSEAKLARSEWTAESLLEKLKDGDYTVEEINGHTNQGQTVLQEAAAHGFRKVVLHILENIDADDKDTINHRDSEDGYTALHCAAMYGRANIVTLLLQHGADSTLRDGVDENADQGSTALDLAIEQWEKVGSAQYEQTVTALISESQLRDIDHDHLIVTAAINGSVPVLTKLLQARVDLNKPDKYGWTPLLLARQYGRVEAEAFLSQYFTRTGLQPSAWHQHWDEQDDSGIDYPTLTKNTIVHHEGRDRLCLLADHPVPAGLKKYYFELEVLDPDQEEPAAASTGATQQPTPPPEPADAAYPPASDGENGPEVALGFTTAVDATALQFPGWTVKAAPSVASWAYHADDGGLYTYTETRRIPVVEAERWGRSGDVVGAGVDFESGTMWFTKNGQRIQALNGLVGAFGEVRGRLFPVLGLSDRVRVRGLFGDEVRWKGEA